MDPQQIEELFPFYVLDALSDEEREIVETYLEEYPEARQEVEELRSAAAALPYGVRPVEPSGHSRRALMSRVAADARRRFPAQASGPGLLRGENIIRTFTLGIATLAVIWVMILNAQVARLRSEISTLDEALVVQSNRLQQFEARLPQTAPSNVITVSLKGTEAQPQAQGQLIADPSSNSAVLVIVGLSPLEPGRTYQVWLIDGGTPVSAGLLAVDEHGQGVLVLTAEDAIGSFRSLGISIEPEGGSRQPTGDIVVMSDL
ncbi:MAG TPA: anti-sigma factor [Chthonomonadales bacterium]|nr:anti-sigma factor [Chthonomonadales bacterium]